MILIFGGGSDIAKAVKGAKLITHKQCDVLNPSTVALTLDMHDPDIVVNCAGISHVGLIKEQSLNKWVEQISTNLIGSYVVAKECAKRDIPVILIASVAGKYGKAEHSAYSVSKGGVITLVQSMAMEGNIAFAISPGRVNTKMREKDYPGEDKRTRLTTKSIRDVILDCVKGKYQPGDNIIVRKIGFTKYIKVDKGQPWKKYLSVKPYGTPKTI